MERMVMKSRVGLNRSAPLTGRLLMPSLRVGSGRCPAATAMSRAADAVASWATSARERDMAVAAGQRDRKSTRLNSSHQIISYAVFCLKKKKRTLQHRCGQTANGMKQVFQSSGASGVLCVVVSDATDFVPEFQG